MKKLAIVGSHPATRDNAPWDDPSYEIWVINEAPMMPWCKRWDVTFQMHLPEVYRGRNHVRADHWDWLQMDHGEKIIYMQGQDPDVPNCRAYPLEAVQKLTPDEMLTSTASQMLALALLKGYEQIDVWGVELSSNSEYSYQLPGWIYWVGFARGMSKASGGEFRLNLHCGVNEHFTNRVYGYQGDPNLHDLYLERIALIQAELKTAEWRLRKLDDTINQAIIEHKYDVVRQGISDQERAAIEFGSYAGALAEAETYASYGDKFVPRQELERHMAQADKDGEGLKQLMFNAGGKCEYVWNGWRMTGRVEYANQLRQFIKEKREHAIDMGARLGIFRENGVYMAEYDKRLQSLGGVRALEQMQ